MGTTEQGAAQGGDDVAALKALLVETKALVVSQAALIAILEEKLRLADHQRFGRKSEKSSFLDIPDLFNEAEAVAAKAPETPELPGVIVPEHTRARGKRAALDPKLPRVRVEHDIPEHEKKCPCGCMKSRIGEEISEQLDIVPARAQVLQNVRFKYACRTCEGTEDDGPTVTIAEMPAQIIPKGMMSPGLVAHVATQKFEYGMPLYRQEKELARADISISRTTLARSMIEAGDAIQPLTNLMQDEAQSYDVLQMDETTVQVLKEDGRAAESKSYMWVRRGGAPGKTVILFDYAPTRAASVPLQLLADYKGYLQSDGYRAYDAACRKDGVIGVGCMGHARRKFHDAVKAQQKAATSLPALAASAETALATPASESAPTLAEEALALIRKLYTVEKTARDNGLTAVAKIRERFAGQRLWRHFAEIGVEPFSELLPDRPRRLLSSSACSTTAGSNSTTTGSRTPSARS
jgi:transposase